MQTMNFEKMVKNLWWFFSASRAIEDIPDSVLFVDSSGFVVRANKKACDCFGITDTEEPIRVKDLISGGMNVINESLRKKHPILAIAISTGNDFYVELNTSRKWNGYFIVVRDVSRLTNEKATEFKIARFNGEKNAMLVKLDSEIKSPLSSIIGFSRGLLDGLGGPLTEKQEKYIKIINSNANESYVFLDKLLEFSYCESSLYEPKYTKFDMIAKLKNILKNYQNVFEAKKIQIDFSYDEIDFRALYFDERAFEIIFKNIIETSCEMIESGCFSLHIRVPNEEMSMTYGLDDDVKYVQFLVKDTSHGIEKEDMKFLCDPYFHLEKGKKSIIRALRLGSASILAKRSEGYIDVSSEIMQGVLYNVILPILREADE